MPEPEYCYLDGYFVNYSDPHDPGAWQFTPFRSEDHRTYRIKIKVPDELRAVELATSVAAAKQLTGEAGSRERSSPASPSPGSASPVDSPEQT